MSVFFRPATEDDLPLFVQWLADPDARAYFLPPAFNDAEEYARGIIANANAPDAPVRVILDFASQPVGYVRVKHNPTWATISLLIDAPHRGRGLGRHVMRLVAEQTLAAHPHLAEVKAFVQKANLASIKACEAAGFVNAGDALHAAPTFRYVFRRNANG